MNVSAYKNIYACGIHKVHSSYIVLHIKIIHVYVLKNTYRDIYDTPKGHFSSGNHII